MVDRASHATDPTILDRIAAIIDEWKTRYSFDRCGIGFGGPVDFENQRVILSTHVAGWEGFDLPHHIEKLIGLLPIMDNDANAGALGEAFIRSRSRLSSALLHDAFHWHRRRYHHNRRLRLSGCGFVRRRNRAPDYSARWPRLPLRITRLPGAHVLRLVAGARSWPAGERADARCRICAMLRCGLGARTQGRHHAAQPGAHRDRRRHQQSRRSIVRSAAPGVVAADNRVVARPHRRCSGRTRRR